MAAFYFGFFFPILLSTLTLVVYSPLSSFVLVRYTSSNAVPQAFVDEHRLSMISVPLFMFCVCT